MAISYNYKFNGKELQETGMYDFGARQYMADIGRWISPDPLSEEFSDWTPYRFGFNNPIAFIDPTGMLETDFVDVESGLITHIEDGKDQVIASNKNTIENMKNLSENNVTAYNKILTVFENSSLNLDMTRSEFDFLAQTLYAESSGGFGESLGILNVLENRATMDGNSIMDQLSDEIPYGVYGVRDIDRYTDEKGAKADTKRSNVHRAIAIGLTTAGDVTNGAYFWDGRDIQTNSHYKSWGVKFSKPGHNLWNQNDKSGRAQLITTASHGKTIFTKFENQGKKWSISK